jgi:tellurite methyltransferase
VRADGPERAHEDPARTMWNDRHTDRGRVAEPARFLIERAHLLPAGGRALDVAGGLGRNAIWLADRGFDVTLLDVSDVAVEGARAAAAEVGATLTAVRTEVTPDTVPDGPFDVVVVHHFLDRPVWARLPATLAEGGVLFVCQPTERNLERHPRPSRRWLLAASEMAAFASAARSADPGLEIVEVGEGWTDEERHEARLVVRRHRSGADPADVNAAHRSA